MILTPFKIVYELFVFGIQAAFVYGLALIFAVAFIAYVIASHPKSYRNDELFDNRRAIKNNTENSLSGSAHYWLGEIYFLQKEYREAALILAEGYQKFPQSIKAADMLYKLSDALFKIDRQTDGCLTLAKFEQDFSNHKLLFKVRTKIDKDCND